MEQIILTETNFNKLKRQVKENTGKKIIFTSNDDELNRKVAEKLPIQILLIPLDERKDYTKQRNSGLNEILAKILKKNNIALGVDFSQIKNGKKKHLLLARLIQNFKLANKINLPINSVNLNKESYEVKSLASILGLHSSLVKNL